MWTVGLLNGETSDAASPAHLLEYVRSTMTCREIHQDPRLAEKSPNRWRFHRENQRKNGGYSIAMSSNAGYSWIFPIPGYRGLENLKIIEWNGWFFFSTPWHGRRVNILPIPMWGRWSSDLTLTMALTMTMTMTMMVMMMMTVMMMMMMIMVLLLVIMIINILLWWWLTLIFSSWWLFQFALNAPLPEELHAFPHSLSGTSESCL